uniref:Uncharacterized protein n=1 Tax=Setaria viridis TaxID=4556 RepID=A0A4U6SRP2_SETVI|nr:hypothetical protein SEVIR_9G045350v2 [Setaria viridis]
MSTASDEAPVEDVLPALEPAAPEPAVPELTIIRVVDEVEVAGGEAVNPATTELIDVVETPEAVADATMVEVDVGWEYANIACSRAYIVSALVLLGLGENTGDLPPAAPTDLAPVASTKPAPGVQAAPVMRKRRRVPPRTAQ